MNKKILLVLMILVICILFALSLGQCKSNTPSKQETAAAPDFSLYDIAGENI